MRKLCRQQLDAGRPLEALETARRGIKTAETGISLFAFWALMLEALYKAEERERLLAHAGATLNLGFRVGQPDFLMEVADIYRAAGFSKIAHQLLEKAMILDDARLQKKLKRRIEELS